MFGTDKNKKKEIVEEKKETSTTAAASVVLAETLIEGNITSHSNIRIDGQVKGNLQIGGKLVIGPRGMVEGQIQCLEATIEGVFKGEIVVTEILAIKEKAQVEGKMTTRLFSVTPGAQIKGTIETTQTLATES